MTDAVQALACIEMLVAGRTPRRAQDLGKEIKRPSGMRKYWAWFANKGGIGTRRAVERTDSGAIS
jgi:hypothetical protein